MMKDFALVAALSATFASAQTEAEIFEYREFAEGMKFFGYSWEPLKVTTDDGFVLTTFHITAKKDQDIPRDESLNPVVMMHGQSCDATSWLDLEAEQLPLPFQLFDRGFDIYMAANRGTKYCQKHTRLTMEDDEFWAWSWAEMGIYDDVSNIKMVKERTGKKVSYLGVSQGTVQMFYALAKLEEEFFADNLFTFAALDPCTIQVNEGSYYYTDGLFHFPEYGITNFGGPHWNRTKNTICDNFDADICEFFSGWGDFGEPFSVQDYIHWAQNVMQGRFQEYAPYYMEGVTETELIDLAQIKKVPVTIWSGLLDQTCSNAQAKITAETLGDRATYFRTVPWASHTFWGVALTQGLYKELEARLIDPEKKSYPLSSTLFQN